VIDGMPSLNSRPEDKLELLQGPERIDYGWWDRPAIDEIITRDYYVATRTDTPTDTRADKQVENGALYWIFHYGGDILSDDFDNSLDSSLDKSPDNSRHGKWYLHGIFS
jgi:hypothetical protein